MIFLQYSNGTAVQFPESGDLTVINITPEKGADKLCIRTSLSLIDVQNVWISSGTPGPEKQNLPWQIIHKSGGNSLFPFVATFNSAGINRSSFATTNLLDDTEIRFALNQENAVYDVCCEIALCEDTQPFELIIDCRNIPWQNVLADWRKKVIPECTFPTGAYDPVYCSWYAVHGNITQDFVETTAPLAKDLGFTTFIADDGWCYDEFKRVSPQTIGSWYETIGDWNVSKEKFPDFKNHVKRIQAIGMKYMLWVAPFLWGLKSELYKTHPGMTIGSPKEGYDTMDIHTAETSLLVERLRKLASGNELDGLKIDFLSIITPDVNKPASRQVNQLIADLTGKIRQDNPDALIEFCQGYSTAATVKYATQFRAGDVPFNWLCNFGRLVELRLALGNAAPIHSDPAYWPFGETAENVARHMMAAQVGIPMISMDLTRLTDTEKQIIRYYTGFYNAHKELINHGNWHFLFGISDVDAAIVENDRERMVIITAASRLNECLKDDGKITTVCNISPCALPVRCRIAVDCRCNPADTGMIAVAGSGILE